jgi:hypothetical protein
LIPKVCSARITVYDETPEGWAWGQLDTDGYVGWFSSDAIQKAGQTNAPLLR